MSGTPSDKRSGLSFVTWIASVRFSKSAAGPRQLFILTRRRATVSLLIINKKFWTELITYFPLIRHGPHWKRGLQFFVAAGTSLPSCYLVTIGGYTDRPTDTRPQIFPFLRVFVAAGTGLPSRCLAAKGRIHFTESLPSNDRIPIHTHSLSGGIF
jgi:hypothetical protein